MQLNRRLFLKQLGFGAAGISLLSSLPGDVWAKGSSALLRTTPEAQGMSSASLLAFANAVESQKLNLHSMMVLRHGNVVAEGWWAPYAPQLKHTLYSLSKSFTSTAVGMAVAEKRLTVEDKVTKFFPDDLPATVSDNLAAMRVKDLLTMSTGHDKEPAVRSEKNWAKAFLAQPVEHQPGTFFLYNSIATYMLSAIVQKLTGQTVLAYLKPRLFDPLGIEGADWEVNPQGINTGGWGLRVKTEDIAKFGQLYLQKGVWKGKQLLPANWIDDATKFEIQSKGGSRKKEENDWLQGYGYQFWRCRHDAYRGDGAFGQYCIVMPKEDIVVAITSETSDMQAILDNVWEHILGSVKGKTLPADAKEQAQLKQKLTALALPIQNVKSTSPIIAQIDNKPFSIADNSLHVKSVALNFGKDGGIFTMQDDKGEHRINCGMGRWVEKETDLSALPLKLTPTLIPGETKTKIASSGTWTDDNTFVLTVRFIETAHYETITCNFDKDTVKVQFKKSLAILNPATKDDRPVLEGRLLA
ncbi:serine hydrolase domain-containing protein [Spirosoma oryzicola]|uniref:serine hydrolase domain-containing protein n=1 Tax=Spirosoma oryzicola TaxID=2898794 RepID=UPI001E4F3F1C|nr:serine hydrolase [Spirosoma oryzicola]UHG92023.1 beta-lactamase family protein [Spirosoma oryzicola]